VTRVGVAGLQLRGVVCACACVGARVLRCVVSGQARPGASSAAVLCRQPPLAGCVRLCMCACRREKQRLTTLSNCFKRLNAVVRGP
jgi:hypothetical protein